MKDNIININLETSTSPVIAEVRGKDWIEYGDASGDWRNLYPQFLIDLYYSSSITAAIINATSEMIAGENLIIEDEEDRDTEARVKLQNFMDRANSNESLHEVIKKLSFDFKLQGAFALNIVYARDRSQGIAEVYHIDVSKIRCARPDEMGRTTGYYISADWTNTRQNKPYYVPAFNPNDRTSANQIMYSGLYSPNMNSYYIPDYVSCNNWSLLDARISEFHLNNVSSGFSGSFMLNFSNGIPTSEERFQIEQSITEKFCSQANAGNFILTFSDDKTRTPEIQAISPSDLDKQFLALQELLTSNICSGHRITSKTLVGIDSTNGFSSNTDEMINAANFFLNTVVSPFQIHLIKQIRKIFQVNQMDMPVNFVQLKPITVQFDSKTIREVMTQDEIREELGLEPLGEEEVIDETVDFSKTEKIELDNWIEKFGEEMPEEWELIEEEIVDGEHTDFDFEDELNKELSKKIELAEVIEGNPNIIARDPKEKDKSAEEGGTENTYIDQDGVNRSFNDYYKVRYVYATDEFLTNKSGTSREFCELMVAANKVYRKRDILNANSLEVNEGFGHYGTERYNLFLFKGGPQCRHYWLRRIYKSSLRNAKKPIKDAEVISHTKALSEGFTVKKNDKLVAIAPQRMVNNGYYN
jgi:hypothetical protein